MSFEHLFEHAPRDLKGMGEKVLDLEGSYNLSKVAAELNLDAKQLYRAFNQKKNEYSEDELLEMYGVRQTETGRFLAVMPKFKAVYKKLREQFYNWTYRPLDYTEITRETFFDLKGFFKLAEVADNPFLKLDRRQIYGFLNHLTEDQRQFLGVRKARRLYGIHFPRGYYFLQGVIQNKEFNYIADAIKEAIRKKTIPKDLEF